METKARQFKILALCDDESTCGFCGKTDLQRVVAFEDTETGEILYAGTTCAQTVRLICLDEETGEAKPMKAAAILTRAQRATRETALAQSLDAIAWQVAYLIDSWRGDREVCSRPIDVSHYTSAPRAVGLLIPVPQGSRVRENAILLAARNWAIMLMKVERAKVLSKREQIAAEWGAWLESYRLKVAAELSL